MDYGLWLVSLVIPIPSFLVDDFDAKEQAPHLDSLDEDAGHAEVDRARAHALVVDDDDDALDTGTHAPVRKKKKKRREM